MKKKTLALLMGLALAVTPAYAFAEEETEAADAIIENTAENSKEISGRIEVISADGTIVISVGELIEDEEDSTKATLQLSGSMYEYVFSDDSTGIKLVEQKVITVEDAPDDDEDETDAENAEETSTEDTDASTETEEDADSEEESETETETEAETELDAEEITVDDLQLGDIITFTVTDGYFINYYVLVGTE